MMLLYLVHYISALSNMNTSSILQGKVSQREIIRCLNEDLTKLSVAKMSPEYAYRSGYIVHFNENILVTFSEETWKYLKIQNIKPRSIAIGFHSREITWFVQNPKSCIFDVEALNQLIILAFGNSCGPELVSVMWDIYIINRDSFPDTMLW